MMHKHNLPGNKSGLFFVAFDLAKEQKLNFGDDIALQLRTARKKRFAIQEEKRIAQEIELQSYLNRLIEEDKDRQVAKVKDENLDLDSETVSDKIREIEEKSVSLNTDGMNYVFNWLFQESYINELNSLFAKVDERRRVIAFQKNLPFSI